jgi:hypothetical protein
VVIMGDPGPVRHPRTGLAAWSLTVLTLAVLAAALVLVALNATRTGASRIGLQAFLSVAVLMYTGSGRLIASRVPGNAIGWLLASIGLSLVTAWAGSSALTGAGTGFTRPPGGCPRSGT